MLGMCHGIIQTMQRSMCFLDEYSQDYLYLHEIQVTMYGCILKILCIITMYMQGWHPGTAYYRDYVQSDINIYMLLVYMKPSMVAGHTRSHQSLKPSMFAGHTRSHQFLHPLFSWNSNSFLMIDSFETLHPPLPSLCLTSLQLIPHCLPEPRWPLNFLGRLSLKTSSAAYQSMDSVPYGRSIPARAVKEGRLSVWRHDRGPWRRIRIAKSTQFLDNVLHRSSLTT